MNGGCIRERNVLCVRVEKVSERSDGSYVMVRKKYVVTYNGMQGVYRMYVFWAEKILGRDGVVWWCRRVMGNSPNEMMTQC